LLTLQIISTSVDLTNENFEQVYRQAKQLSDTMPGGVVYLRHGNGSTIFNTLAPLGTPLERANNNALLSAEDKARG
jgi:hypothetical protein